jgi:hypothetical protein
MDNFTFTFIIIINIIVLLSLILLYYYYYYVWDDQGATMRWAYDYKLQRQEIHSNIWPENLLKWLGKEMRG